MKKKIVIIVIAAVLVLAAAGTACFVLFFPKTPQPTADEIIKNSYDAMFGEAIAFFGRAGEVLDAKKEKSTTLEVRIPSSLTHFSHETRLTGEFWKKGNDSSVFLMAKLNKDVATFVSCLEDGRFDSRFDVQSGTGNPVASFGFNIEGLSETLSESWMNPEKNPDSPFGQETYDSLFKLAQTIEKTYTAGQQSSAGEIPGREEFAKRLDELRKKLDELPEITRDVQKKKKENPKITVTIAMSNEKLLEAFGLIREFAEDEDVRNYLDAAAELYGSSFFVNFSGDGDPAAIPSGSSGSSAGEDSSGEQGSPDSEGSREEGKEDDDSFFSSVGELFDAIDEDLRRSGIKADITVSISDYRIDTVKAVFDFKYKSIKLPSSLSSGAGRSFTLAAGGVPANGGPAVPGSLAAGASAVITALPGSSDGAAEGGGEAWVPTVLTFRFEADYTNRTVTLVVEDVEDGESQGSVTLSASQNRSNSTSTWTFDIKVKEPGKEEIDRFIKIEYSPDDGAFSVSKEDGEFLSGILQISNDRIDLSIGKLSIRRVEHVFEYGEGFKEKVTDVQLTDGIALTVVNGDGARHRPEAGDDLFGDKMQNGRKLLGENGTVTQALSLASEKIEENTYWFRTADGYYVSPKSKAVSRAEKLVQAYTAYVKALKQSGAFSEEVACVYLADPESRLFYLLEYGEPRSAVYVLASMTEEETSQLHPASVTTDGRFLVHNFRESHPQVDCGQKNYTVYTCGICGFEIVFYDGDIKPHKMTGQDVSFNSVTAPGKKTVARVQNCSQCGRRFVTLTNSRLTVAYKPTEGGWEADSLSDAATFAWLSYLALEIPGESGKLVRVGSGFAGIGTVCGVYVPDGVKEIAPGAFSDMKLLRSVVLPASLEKIGAGAFADCGVLNTVFFRGTKAQWERIEGSERLSCFRLVFNCADSFGIMSKSEMSLAAIGAVAKNETSLYYDVKNKGAGTVLSNTPGVTPVDIIDTYFYPYDGVNGVFAIRGDRNGSVLVLDAQGKQVASRKFSSQNAFPFAAGGGRIYVFEGGGRLAGCNSLTLETEWTYDLENGRSFFRGAYMGDSVYAVTDAGVLRIRLNSGESEYILTEKYYNLVPDEQSGCLYCIAYYAERPVHGTQAQTAVYYPDTGESTVLDHQMDSPYYDGSGITSAERYKVNYDANGMSFSYEALKCIHLTPDGPLPVSAALMTAPKGYTPFRFVYDDGETQIYTAFNSKNAVSTVIVWNGRTKVIPAVPENLINLGGGKILLYRPGGYQIAIVDASK